MRSAPSRLLFLRPDTYGDLVLFEPVLRLLRAAWPKTEIAVLIRKPYTDLAPLLADKSVRWLTTTCNPYSEGPQENRAALKALRKTVQAFAPDCLVAACFDQTWLEPVIASFLPSARQVRLGSRPFDEMTRAILEAEFGVEWKRLYSEKVVVEADATEWKKNLRLAETLLARNVPALRPTLRVPASARKRARTILEEAGLEAGAFVVCCAAGTANVKIKAWPAERYGATLAWLERERGIRALLVGHATERETLESVCESAHMGGANPARWLGRDGEMPVVAALAEAAQFYFGNDTGTLHIAAALDRPAVSIFGGGHWPRFKPAARRSAVLIQPLPCFGCGWNCLFGYAPCVREIPESAAREAIDWLLTSDADGERVIVVEDVIPATGRDIIDGVVAVHRARGANEADGELSLAPGTLTSVVKRLNFSETDRIARLQVIERQGAEITRLQAEIERWLEEAGALWPKLNATENARNLLAAELENLRSHFAASEADRAARLQVIEEQGAEITRLQAEIERWLGEAGALWPKLNATENARNLLATELENLRGHFAASEADRAARLLVIEEQGTEITRLHAEVERWLGEAGALWPKLNAVENARNQLAAELEEQGAEKSRLLGREAELVADVVTLRRRLKRIERHWTTRLAEKLRLRSD